MSASARYADADRRSAKPALRLSGVHKQYRLYGSLSEQALDVLGLSRLRFWRRIQCQTFSALDGIDLEIGHGERVGIVGRNGAGKTTMLKLITGNFVPTEGEIEVDGDVQALMQMGLGFHGEFTGIENIKASLVYNGLSEADLDAAIVDVAEFCELGDFLYQPIKSYSLGMRTRLQFATATAIHPDILIVDEVLGAGDAYFAGKSAARMKRLTASGCTLLLVSHSIQQILQFCTRVVWLECGRVVMDGPALQVVRAYEEFSKKLERENDVRQKAGQTSGVLNDPDLQQKLLAATVARADVEDTVDPEVSTAGLVRWQGEGGLTIDSVRIRDSRGVTSRKIVVGEPAEIEFTVRADHAGCFPATFVVVIYDIEDKLVTRQIGSPHKLTLSQGDSCVFVVSFDEVLFGPGHYYFSAAIYRALDLDGDSPYYDLLNRAIQFEVVAPDPHFIDSVKQGASWTLRR